jgi:transcriptional regulator with XRE-family HTH domain
MFQHLGRALVLLRSLRGKSQSEAAREAGMGKSQLSKYENGQEVPKLESLEKLLRSLGVGLLDLASLLALIDERAARLGGGDRLAGEVEAGLLLGGGLLPERMQETFGSVLRDLLALHRLSVQHLLFGADEASGEPSSRGR